jgi:DNA-binding response OmpR family regulator
MMVFGWVGRKPLGDRRRAAPATRLRVADLELDEDGHEVRRDGTLIALTPTEFRLQQFLMLNAGRVLSKGQILDHVWGHNPAGEGNVVEPCVSYLRGRWTRVSHAPDSHHPRRWLRRAVTCTAGPDAQLRCGDRQR